MDTLPQVESMSNDQVLATFGTAEEPERRGFDEATYTKVLAYELVRSRHRLVYYRTLYTSFISENAQYMIENLDESENGSAVPVKLVFADQPDEIQGVEADAPVIVWTEPDLIDELEKERAVHDFLTDLLDELEPAVQG